MWGGLGSVGLSLGKFHTLHFDGSHNNQANKSGAGCIIRNSQEELVVAAAYNLTETYPDYCTVAIAEAVALLNGLKLAKQCNLKLNLIKGDSKEVIDHVLGCSRRPSSPPLSGIIQQIIGMIDRFSQEIVIIDREDNQVADKLASWGSNRLEEGGRKYTIYDDLPPQVAELIRQDKLRAGGEGGRLGMAGAAIAGVAMLAWGVSKMFGESSSEQQLTYKQGKAPQTWGSSTNNYAYKRPQNNECYTLHYSGSDINQLRNGGAGFIIRNKHGDLVTAAAYNLDNLFRNQYNVAIGEAIAWRNGLKWGTIHEIQLDRIKGDNEEVINRVLGLGKKPPKVPLLDEIIHEIRKALREQSIESTQVERIGTEANKIANKLALFGSNLENGEETTYDMAEFLPYGIATLIEQDKINWV